MALLKTQKESLVKSLPAGRLFFDLADRPEYTHDATELIYIPTLSFCRIRGRNRCCRYIVW